MDSDMTTSLNLGADVLIGILSILPPKALMRFKCVSKWWDHLSTSPEFIVKHLSKHYLSSNTTSVLFTRTLLKPEVERCLMPENSDDHAWTPCFLHFGVSNDNTNDVDNNNGTFACNIEDIDAPALMRGRHHLYIAGHCDGIVCVQSTEFCATFLWNPAIEQFKLLPPDLHHPNWDQKYFQTNVGFGYDPKSDDYKVIDIINGYHYETPYGDPERCEVFVYPPRVAVYTLGSDAWKEIDTAGCLETATTNLWPDDFQVYFKGMCYWVGHEQNKVMSEFDVYAAPENIRDGVIIVFDTSCEVFHEMPLPDSCRQLSNCYPRLYNIRILARDKSIALFGVHADEYPSHIGIWVMEEVGGGPMDVTWIKHLSLDVPWIKHLSLDANNMPMALAFWKSDEILMIYHYYRGDLPSVVSYSSRTEIFNSLSILAGTPTKTAFIYVRSIVPVTGRIKASKLENNV